MSFLTPSVFYPFPAEPQVAARCFPKCPTSKERIELLEGVRFSFSGSKKVELCLASSAFLTTTQSLLHVRNGACSSPQVGVSLTWHSSQTSLGPNKDGLADVNTSLFHSGPQVNKQVGLV